MSMGTRINRLMKKGSQKILLAFPFKFHSCFLGSKTSGTEKKTELGNTLSMYHWELSCVIFPCIQIEKCPFKGTGKISKLFCLIPQGLTLYLTVESDARQNKIPWGTRPHGTKLLGISDFADQNSSGCQNPGNITHVGIRPSGTKYIGVEQI
jgi:hypothetical protein